MNLRANEFIDKTISRGNKTKLLVFQNYAR